MDYEHDLERYTWIIVCSSMLALFASFGIGANDAANSLSSSVGSGALSMRYAVLMASICEFIGALFMSSQVVKTIRKGIADYECFEDQPEILMYGCMCVIGSVGSWLLLASKYELPVSTTHSVVGGMIGMTLVSVGSDCVIWDAPSDEFPYRTGVSAIVLSWIISPVLSGICSSFLFWCLRTFCLRQEKSDDIVWKIYPLLTFVVMTINTFFLLWKGVDVDITTETKSLISVGSGGCFALLSLPVINMLRSRVEHMTNEIQSLDTIIENDSDVKNVHENTERFAIKTENALTPLQICTAAFDALAHGSNDVANSIGPFAAVYMIYKENGVQKTNDLGDDAYWIFAIGGVGIALGIAIYGYKIIEAIGMKLAKITPSRGLCIEMGSTIVVICGSHFGWPLSTTHCQVGSTTAVALVDGKRSINLNILYKTMFGWIITLLVVGLTSGLLTAQGIYSPEKVET